MMVCASLSVAKRADLGISADATIQINGKAHDTTACTFAAPLLALRVRQLLKTAFPQACDEPHRGMPQLFFRYGIEPRKVVAL